MAETSKNKIYYNDNENSVADVLADMKKMAESTDKAIENSKYNDAQIKKDISDAKKEQALKDAEQDNKIIELQNEKAKLEKELKEAQEDFYQNSIRGQASGEYIHVEDSSNCRARIGIGGNSEQKMRSGKNYLNTLAKYKAGEKVTVDGITYIFNEDGSITCNGTATADSVLTFSSNLQTINGSGKKIVGMITGTQVPAKLSILAYTSDWSKNTFELLSSVNKNITINMQENIDYTIFRIIAYKGTTLNNQTIYYQILDTSVNDLTYEQYGASPSPDYQSEIESVGSNVNIFDKDNPDMFLNGLTPDNSGNIVSTLTDTTKTNYIITIIVPCKGNKQYTISRWLSGKTFIVYESEKNKFNINDKVTLLKRNDNSGIINETIATSANAKYILVKIYSTWGNEENTYNDLISSIKIEKGKVATSYSKYGQGCVKVTKCNKNIMPILNLGNNYEYTGNGIKSLKKNDGVEVTRFKVRKGQTIKIGLKMISRPSKDSTYSIYFKDNNNNIASFPHINDSSYIELNKVYEKRYTANEDGEIFIKLWGNTSSDIFEFQLWAELDNLTEYEQHEEQSYIMPTQQSMKSTKDIRDTFIKKDGKWYERHNIYRYVFDGNENFKILDSNSKFGMIVTKNKAKIVSKNDSRNLTYCLSNRFVNNTQFNATKMSNKIAFSQWSDTQYLYLSKIKDSVDELKNYLAANETYVDYPLETPIDLECTEEQSKILDELNNARTYKNVTNITTDSKAILSLDYAKDLETLLTSKESEV